MKILKIILLFQHPSIFNVPLSSNSRTNRTYFLFSGLIKQNSAFDSFMKTAKTLVT